jgi:small-conductance mechanosensitive channel
MENQSAHERFGSSFVEPFKSQGVTDMDDSAMIIRAKFKAIPEKRYEIRKEVYARVQKALHDNGIKFAHRRVMVDLPPGTDANAAYGKAIADAAAAALVADAPAKTP